MKLVAPLKAEGFYSKLPEELIAISAFAGRDFVLEAYNHAVVENYRFFSLDDGMFVK